MRFLCLHGAGSNSKIFESQTALLRRELGPRHTFEFVEGTVTAELQADINSIVTANEQGFAYYEPDNATSFRKAIADLRHYVQHQGPFDGVIAFSQGTSITAALLCEWKGVSRQEDQHPKRSPDGSRASDDGCDQLVAVTPTSSLPFKCAVFLAGRRPYIDAGDDYDCSTLSFPTGLKAVHIWGTNDTQEPGEGQKLFDLAISDGSTTDNTMMAINNTQVLHAGGHEVPGSRDPKTLYDCARAIRAMISTIEEMERQNGEKA